MSFVECQKDQHQLNYILDAIWWRESSQEIAAVYLEEPPGKFSFLPISFLMDRLKDGYMDNQLMSSCTTKKLTVKHKKYTCMSINLI